MRAATIYDVARRAGVSHQTVSRYLSGFEGIRPETRARVESALTDLDYRPNAAARYLRAQRINRIGVLADRRVGYVSGPLPWIAARERMAGFRSRMEEGGGELVWTREGDWTAPSGSAAWATLSPEERRVTAVATGNDSTAIGLMSAAEA